MRSIYALASLLLIFFFLSNEAQGIRLGNGMMKPAEQLEKAHEEKISLNEEEGLRKITLCENGHCSSGNNRKLLTATSPLSQSPPTTRNEKGNKNGKPMSSKKEEQSVKEEKDLDNSKAVSENLEAGLEHYPDLIDIAEMDYSPAKRKPPIHN